MFVRVAEKDVQVCVLDFETGKKLVLDRLPLPLNRSVVRIAKKIVRLAGQLNSLVAIEIFAGQALLIEMQRHRFYNFWIWKVFSVPLQKPINTNKIGLVLNSTAIWNAFPKGYPKTWQEQISGLAKYCLRLEKEMS